MTPPDDQKFGELVGEVRAIGRQITRLETSLQARHDNHEKRIDALETIRDEGKGAARFIQVGKGAMVFALLVATFVISKGGI